MNNLHCCGVTGVATAEHCSVMKHGQNGNKS